MTRSFYSSKFLKFNNVGLKFRHDMAAETWDQRKVSTSV
jgi:hypothetical protein